MHHCNHGIRFNFFVAGLHGNGFVQCCIEGFAFGIEWFDGKSFLNYSEVNGLIGTFVFSIEFADDRSLWMGSHHGMNRFKFDPKSHELINIE